MINTTQSTTHQYSTGIHKSTPGPNSRERARSESAWSFYDVLKQANSTANPPSYMEVFNTPQVSKYVDAAIRSNMYVQENTWYDKALNFGSPTDGESGEFSTSPDNANHPPQQYLSGESAKGSTVEILQGQGVYTVRVTDCNGSEFLFNTTENTAIQERSDGGLNITLQESGKRYILSPDGTLQDDDGKKGTDTFDDILININGDLVDGGDGNDLIFNFADNATILGGYGDDTVVLGNGLKHLRVDTGHGDDVVRGFSADDVEINLGHGDDILSMNRLGNGSQVDVGEGDNTVHLRRIENKTAIVAGNGNNFLEVLQLSGDTSITAGNGNNTVSAYTILDSSSVTLGNGNNIIDVACIGDHSTLQAGDGNNIIHVSNVYGESEVGAGNGNNIVTTVASTDSTMHFGNGNNRIMGLALYDERLQLGDGNNELFFNFIKNSDIEGGNGNNSLSIKYMQSSMYKFGNGNNMINIMEIMEDDS